MKQLTTICLLIIVPLVSVAQTDMRRAKGLHEKELVRIE